MNWFWLALASMVFYGIQSLLLKTAAAKNRNSIRVNTAFMLTVAVISGVLFMFTSESVVSGPFFMLFVIGNGITYLFANICKIESYKFTPIKIAQPIARLYIAVTPILAFFIFRERISFLQLVGLTLATLTVVILGSEHKEGKIRRNYMMLGLVFALAAALSTSFNNIIGKSAASTGDVMSFIFFSYLFSFIMAMGLQRIVNKDKNPIEKLISDYSSTRLGIITGVVNFCAYYLLLRALITGPAMVIFPIIGLGMIVNSYISVWIFKEKMTKQKILAGACALLAIALMQ